MCGIGGVAYVDSTREVDDDRLLTICNSIAHRGPDGEGRLHRPGVGLAHRRLAIIDVATGQQPLSNEDGTVWVAFNGEIYNYREITSRLMHLGHRFRTRSDTEVLVHAYEEYGLDFVKHLNGIFAFALYDEKRRRVVMARDPVGVKPLFYSVTPEGLFFGSEIKAVLAGTGAAPRILQEAIGEYLMFRYLAGTRSFFEDVHRLPPGHLGVWENGRLAISGYWTVPEVERGNTASESEATHELDERLRGAVESQMMSEVPLGTFCSGGVDSGLITGYASRLSPYRLHTFSVGFADPRWDESPLARDTATRFGTEHHVLLAAADEFHQTLSRLVWHFDEPLNHPNSIPIYLLSRFARKHVTVVLTGEGSDELFGGYPRYHIARLRSHFGTLRTPFATSMGALARGIPGHRASLLADVFPRSMVDSILLNSRYVSPRTVSRLVGYDVLETLDERRALAERTLVPNDPIASITRYETLTYLGSLLDRIDRMSMASGLEARVPFLDSTVLEWGLRLPSRFKVRGRTNKRVVKQLARRMLDSRVTFGAKSGFGVPLGSWFRSSSFAGLMARMTNPAHPASQHFDHSYVRRLVSEHLNASADHGQVLWLLANIYVWYEVHGASAVNRDQEMRLAV